MLSKEQAFARANGRRRYNRLQRLRKIARQERILALLQEPTYQRAAQLGRYALYRALALVVGCCVRTAQKDLKALLSRSPVCPLCGQDVPQSKQDKKIK